MDDSTFLGNINWMFAGFLLMMCRLTNYLVWILLIGGVVTNTVIAEEHDIETAIFAGGCFWCMQPPYDKTDGVIETIVGYTGGHVNNPTYEDVSGGDTGHTEAIKLIYKPKIVNYSKLVEIFWKNVDFLDHGGQFCDRGNQYRSEIFVNSESQRKIAEDSKRNLESAKGVKVVTKISDASEFFSAEEYHQSYYKKNPIRYKFYRSTCKRDRRLKELWEE